MFIVDANVLVCAADVSAPEHKRCGTLLKRWHAQAPLASNPCDD